MKLSTETVLGEVQSIVLETDGLESQDEPHPHASFGILSTTIFHGEQKNLMLLH